MQKIIVSNVLKEALEEVLTELSFDKLFVLVDENTEKECLPTFCSALQKEVEIIKIPAGEEAKNIHSLMTVWDDLSKKKATRSSLLINLGGGMVTDLGGFAAATFKRGISFLNLPTTLLGAVDAAIGGKTGIDFNGLKNEIGAFYLAKAVIVCPLFFRTLSKENLLSGFAEMLKHALLSSTEVLFSHLKYSFLPEEEPLLQQLVKQSIEKKLSIVEQDPTEKGLRKALNFGHTIGHAIESRLLERGTPVLHGYAVAWGMVAELYLSYKKMGFPPFLLSHVTRYVREKWGDCPISCEEYEEIFSMMSHDKKNIRSGEINFTFLSDVGEICLNQTAYKEQIFESLDYLREG